LRFLIFFPFFFFGLTGAGAGCDVSGPSTVPFADDLLDLELLAEGFVSSTIGEGSDLVLVSGGSTFGTSTSILSSATFSSCFDSLGSSAATEAAARAGAGNFDSAIFEAASLSFLISEEVLTFVVAALDALATGGGVGVEDAGGGVAVAAWRICGKNRCIMSCEELDSVVSASPRESEDSDSFARFGGGSRSSVEAPTFSTLSSAENSQKIAL
jgi:hypothetical protein